MLLYLSMIDDGDDRAAFVRIYRQYADGVFRRALGVLKNRHDAEDAMQETWLRVAKNVHVLRGKEERVVCAYIMKVALNQSITLYRERARREEHTCEMQTEELATDGEVWDACASLALEEIRESFAALPEHYRDVLSLYFFYHHSIREIARLLDMKPATVNSRLTRGRSKLIELLKERGYHG
ncbi:MAG: sigma-70 family RNA polymerase sigma factor [Clostridia bacterium]|nr:sigma-70 family RNA polymerase sigma factor [Clostridia bacterium]